MPFHVVIRMRHEVKVETKIKGLRIVGNKGNSLQMLQVRMFENAADKPRTQALSSSFFLYVNVAEIGVGDVVRDHPGQTDLPATFHQ